MSLDTITKTVDEKPTFEMKFTGKLPEGDSINTVTSVDVSVYSGTGTISPGTSIIQNGAVFVRYTGGESGSVYLVKIKVLTNFGDTLENSGLLKVQDVVLPA